MGSVFWSWGALVGLVQLAMTLPAFKTKVFINGRFAAQAQTGVQRYALESLKALDELLAQNPLIGQHIELVLALPKAAQVNGLKHIATLHIPGKPTHFWEQTALLWAARGSLLLNFNYSGPVLKRHQIITIHDATVCAFPQSFSRAYRLVHHVLIALLKKRVARIMTISSFSKSELNRYFGIQHAVVGTEGWQHSVSQGDSAGVMRKYGLEPGRYLFAAGSLKPNKNFSLIAKAFELLPGYPLKLAIAGAQDISIFSQHRVLNNPMQVQTLGYVPEADLAHLYRNAAWFVFPSLYEGFGLPAIEAMANGCPVIAARAASIPEVCGDAALYFDPYDARSLANILQKIIEQPTLRDDILARVPSRLEQYSWQRNAEIILCQIAQLSGRSLANHINLDVSKDVHAAS
jgi:glycosyltransferase involved in cell wall biosynthesis